jgi:hypothetical protein
MGQRTQIICKTTDYERNEKTRENELTTKIYCRHLQWGHGFAMAKQLLTPLALNMSAKSVKNMMTEDGKLREIDLDFFTLPFIREHCMTYEDNNNGALIIDIDNSDENLWNKDNSSDKYIPPRIGFLAGVEDVGKWLAFQHILTLEDYIYEYLGTRTLSGYYATNAALFEIFNRMLKMAGVEYFKTALK